jgi:hypothetical protein
VKELVGLPLEDWKKMKKRGHPEAFQERQPDQERGTANLLGK